MMYLVHTSFFWKYDKLLQFLKNISGDITWPKQEQSAVSMIMKQQQYNVSSFKFLKLQEGTAIWTTVPK